MTRIIRTESIECTERPWGWYETASEVAGNKVKRTCMVCGIRPEHFTNSCEGGLRSTVLLVEPLGSGTQVTVQIGETRVLALFRDRLSLIPGDTIHLQPVPEVAHLFDVGTAMRIRAAGNFPSDLFEAWLGLAPLNL